MSLYAASVESGDFLLCVSSRCYAIFLYIRHMFVLRDLVKRIILLVYLEIWPMLITYETRDTCSSILPLYIQQKRK